MGNLVQDKQHEKPIRAVHEEHGLWARTALFEYEQRLEIRSVLLRIPSNSRDVRFILDVITWRNGLFTPEIYYAIAIAILFPEVNRNRNRKWGAQLSWTSW